MGRAGDPDRSFGSLAAAPMLQIRPNTGPATSESRWAAGTFWTRATPVGICPECQPTGRPRTPMRDQTAALRDDRGMSEPLSFDRFLALPRLSALKLSPDGRRLVVAVSRPGPEGKDMKTALWQVDPTGAARPRRITRSAAGESVGCFLRDGSLLFTSTRPDPDTKADPDKKINALWLLPAEGGEARLLLAPDGGIDGVAAARETDAIVFGAHLHPDASDMADDADRAKARKEAGVGALLFDSYPIRYWDEWLAPRRRRLFAATTTAAAA